MSFEKAKSYLDECGFGERVMQFTTSSATVELAAAALGTEPAKIAKSLTFMVADAPIMIICAGDYKVNNSKFKKMFAEKAKMLTREQVSELIGHEVGGVCPFGINRGVKVYTDISLQRFDYIFPACGSGNSAVKLTPDELYYLANAIEWADVCVPME